MPLTRLQRASEWLSANQSAMVDELIALCNINSASENLSGLRETADFLEHLFGDLQLECVRHTLEPREWIDDFGNPQHAETGPALEWTHPCESSKRVLLAIHYDTVYPPHHELQQCTRLEQDRLQGPGVIDAKGGIIVLRWALLAGIKFGLVDRLHWTILLNPDEEIGSPSSSQLWKKIAPSYDFALLFEPAMADGCLVHSRKGSGNFLWLVTGKSAHSGRNFGEGRNAIVRASRLAVELSELNGKCDGVTINVGRMQGGGPLNVVPDLCALRVNVRVENLLQRDWVEEQFQRIVQSFEGERADYTCRLEGGFTSPPKILDSSTEFWMREVQWAAEQVGQTVRWKSSGGASDGNKLAHCGLPNIDTFGPEGDGLHSPQEWLQMSSLPKKGALTLSMLSRIAAMKVP